MEWKQWVDALLSKAEKKPFPILSFPGIQLIGCSVGDLVRDGGLQALCMKAIADRYPTLASVSLMDLSVEAEAFGAHAVFSEEEVPSITGVLLDSEEDVAQLKIPSVGAARTGEYVKAIAQAVGMIQDRPVFAGVIGPFSLSARLMGMTETMYHAVDEPEMVEAVLEKATTFLLDYIRAFRDAGAHGIVMAEPAAGLLSPDWNARFSAPYVKRIVSELQSDTFPVVYHNCGNTVPLIDEIVATGAKAFHFGNAIRLSDLIGKIPADRLVMGNIDPAGQFTHGTPDSIREAVRSLVDTLGEQPNFVLSSGCDIPPKAPLANIDAFFEAAGC